MDTLEKHIDRFTNEFRTSLSLVLGPTEQILSQSKLDESYVHTQARLIKRHSQKVLHQVNQLLDMTRLKSKKNIAEQYWGDLTDFIFAIAKNFQDTARQKHIRFNLNSQLPVDDYLFDREKIEKIMDSLLSYLIGSTAEGGNILLTILPNKNPKGEEGTSIIVQNTALENTNDDLRKTFETPLTTNDYEETELSLALAKELVGLMKGTIKMDSEEGKGAKFTLFLPLHPVSQSKLNQVPPISGQDLEEEESVPEKQNVPIDLQSEKPVVLIVENNTDLRSFIQTHLAPSYQILTAHDGVEGIDQALKHIPALIICGETIPEKDGYEVCSTLKRNPSSNHIPIIILAAWASLKNRLRSLESGADAYLIKPFSLEELTLRTRQLITTRKLLKEKYQESHPKPNKIQFHEKSDQNLIDQLHAFIEKQLDNETLEIEALVKETGMSRSQLYRKVKAATNLSLAGFIRDYRLKRAMDLLREGPYNVTEVTYLTGFSNRYHFYKSFVEKYKQAPSEVRKGTSLK